MTPQFGQWKVKFKMNGKDIEGREVVLPMPESANNRLMPRRGGGMCNTKKYNQALNAMRVALRKRHLPMLEGDIACFVTFVFDTNRKQDADNRLKCLFDAGTESKCLYADDSQIKLFTVEVKIIPNHNFVLMYVFKRDDLPTQNFEVDEEYLLNDVVRRIDEESAK